MSNKAGKKPHLKDAVVSSFSVHDSGMAGKGPEPQRQFHQLLVLILHQMVFHIAVATERQRVTIWKEVMDMYLALGILSTSLNYRTRRLDVGESYLSICPFGPLDTHKCEHYLWDLPHSPCPQDRGCSHTRCSKWDICHLNANTFLLTT